MLCLELNNIVREDMLCIYNKYEKLLVKIKIYQHLDLFLISYLHWWCNFINNKIIIMNKVISHIYYIYITYPLSQYYSTLDITLAIKLSLHLICFIIRLYPCNINPHLVNMWLLFCILLINMTVLWSLNTTNGWNVHHNCFKSNNQAGHFFFNCGYFFLIFVKVLRKKCNSADICPLYHLRAKLHQYLHH
jgi:hypothetical protein